MKWPLQANQLGIDSDYMLFYATSPTDTAGHVGVKPEADSGSRVAARLAPLTVVVIADSSAATW